MPQLTKEQIQQALEQGVSREQIERYIQTGNVSKPLSLEKAISNVPESGVQFVKDISNIVIHPLQTIEGLSNIIVGGASKLIPGELLTPRMEEAEQTVEAMGQILKEKYGSMDAIKRTIEEDPVGFAADLSGILMAGAGIVRGGARVAGLGRTAQIAERVGAVGRAIEPISLAGRGIKGISKSVSRIMPPVVTEGIRTIGRGVKSILPSAETVKIGTIAAAKKIGVELPAMAVSGSRFVELVEGLAAKGMFGRKIVNRLEEAVSKMNSYADDVVKKIGKSTDLTEIGNKIKSSLDNYRKKWIETKNNLYDNFEKVTPGAPRVSFDKTTKFIKNIIFKKKRAERVVAIRTDLSFFEKQLKKLQRKDITIQQARAAFDELSERLATSGDPVITGNKAILNRMIFEMSQDIDSTIGQASIKIKKALDAANKFYEDGLLKMNEKFGKKVKSFANQPDKILPAMLSPSTSIDDIKRMYQIIGPENVKSVQAYFLEDLFNKAKGMDGNFTPGGLSRQIKQFGKKKIEVILDSKQVSALENIDKVARSLSTANKIIGGSQTAFLLKIGGELALLATNPLLAMKIIVADAVFSSLISSNLGQKLLTAGIDIRRLKGIEKTKQGLRIIITPFKKPEMRQAAVQIGRLEEIQGGL